MIIKAFQCPNCKGIVYSRTKHDHRSCHCTKLVVANGLDNPCVLYQNKEIVSKVSIKINISKEVLFDDWNRRIDNFGRIPKFNTVTKVSNFTLQRRAAVQGPENL